MFVCVIPSPSLLSSVPPVSFRREVTALSVMSVCFHIDRPFCQKQDLDACFRWGKRGIQMARRKSEEGEGKNTHNRAAGGNAEAKDNFMQRGKDFFSPWLSEKIWNACVTLSIQWKLYCCTGFGSGGCGGAGAVVTGCFSPCLRLQQRQILLIEARIRGFPKARTHTRCQQLCRSSETVQKSTACSHMALELIVTVCDKEILFVL